MWSSRGNESFKTCVRRNEAKTCELRMRRTAMSTEQCHTNQPSTPPPHPPPHASNKPDINIHFGISSTSILTFSLVTVSFGKFLLDFTSSLSLLQVLCYYCRSKEFSLDFSKCASAYFDFVACVKRIKSYSANIIE